MNNLPIFWLLLLNISFPSLYFAQNVDDDGLVPTILSNLWELDSDNRNRIQQKHLNGIEGKNLIDGLMNSFGLIPFKREYCNYCDGWIDAESTNDFLVALNSTQIFQNAAAQFAPNSFLQSFQELFFSPQNNPPFISLFCQFSMDSATSFSLLGNYHQLADKLVETVADEDTLLIRLRGEDGKMAKRRILLGPSPQFELTAIALCAIYGEGGGKGELGWKHCTAKIGNGKMLRIALKMNEDGKVIAYFPQIQQRKPPKPNPNPELQKLVEQLWAKDVDRVEPGTISLNWQGKLKNGQVADISPDPLFANVNETFLQKPIYAALVEIYKEKDFHEQVCEEEPPMSQERRQKFEKLWGLIIGSEVFKTVYKYLDKLNKTGGDFDGFCDKLFGFWFGTYSRCKQKHRIGGFWHQNEDEPLGSSGFEHVFSGEWRQGIVEGHHNWIRYYLQERDGDINYHGYFGHKQQNYIGTFQYKWKGFLKKIGGFFFQTSPAFDFSIFTVCVLTQPGNEQCQFELFNNSKLFITSFRQPCQHGSSCIATTYPGEWY